jgi:hypothetical protein
MQRRDLSTLLLASAAGAALLPRRAEAQSCTAPCFARTANEITAGVVPTDYSYPPYDVRRYGALGNGVADDTAAIQNAINAATAVVVTGGVPAATAYGAIYIPANRPSQCYKTTQSLVVLGQLKIVGDGSASTTILSTQTSGYILDFNIPGTTTYHFIIQGITLRSLVGTSDALHLKNTPYTELTDVVFYGTYRGVTLEGTSNFTHLWEQVTGYGNAAYTVWFKSFSGGAQFQFNNCTFNANTGFVFDTSSATDGLCFVNCNFEACTVNSLYIGGTVAGLSLIGCRTEACQGGNDFQINPSLGNTVRGLSIVGCSFHANSAACTAILLGGAGGLVRGFNICGNTAGYSSMTQFVNLNGEGESGVISGNRFEQPNTTPTNVMRHGVFVIGNENSSGKCADAYGLAWSMANPTAPIVFAKGVSLNGAAMAAAPGIVALGNGTQGTVGAAGGASAQPATPLGYLVAYLGATRIAIPFHSA